MINNQNEKYLLKFISTLTKPQNKPEDDLMSLIYNFGIKLNFKNHNPVYQIIDELRYSKYQKNLFGNKK